MNYYILLYDYKIGWDRGVPIDYHDTIPITNKLKILAIFSINCIFLRKFANYKGL